ncbi:hypothetical protein EOD39_5830 [Acipenser ruthenus]|uniref:Uncharacterized protein n=1 Tax=Acipenser ruthenus TaxID=7906 RepID=A0A444UCS8_ACIRT|nr:hypothetical protein EOD39_5830 [Acipenser ruthenus]
MPQSGEITTESGSTTPNTNPVPVVVTGVVPEELYRYETKTRTRYDSEQFKCGQVDRYNNGMDESEVP